jgi:hypothetical protein
MREVRNENLQTICGRVHAQVTVDTYGHLIPGVGDRYVYRLDAKTSQQQSATQAQPASEPEKPESLQVVEMIGSGGADRTPDLGIMRSAPRRKTSKLKWDFRPDWSEASSQISNHVSAVFR